MLELYINGRLCDLSGDETISIDYAMFSLDDLSKRNGVRSYSFKIPDTTNNRIALEIPSEITNISILPYTKIDCRLLVDGIDIGILFAELTEFEDGYSINVYGGNSGFFSSINGKKLIDLELSDYDHFFEFNTVVSSRANTEGYIYPVIDYFKTYPNSFISDSFRRLRADYLQPAIFMKTAIDKIISEAGYSLQDETCSANPEWLTAILPGHKELKSNLFGGKYQGKFGTTNSFTVGDSAEFAVPLISDIAISYNYNYWQLPIQQFTIPELCDIEWSLTFQVTNSNALTTITLNVLYGSDGLNQNFSIPPLTTETHTITVVKNNAHNAAFEQQNGMYGVFASFYDDAGGQLTITTNTTITISKVIVKEQVNLIYGDYISASAILPDRLQAELLKDYLQITSSIITIDEINKIVYIKPFKAVVNNINNVVDFSDKLDFSRPPIISFAGDYYAQANKLTYKEQNEEVKPIGTDGVIYCNNQNLPAEKIIVELIFAATNRVGRLSLNPDPLNVENEIYINRIGIYTEESQNGGIYSTTSSDTFTVGFGSKTFTVQEGLSFKEGDRVGISEFSGGTGYMEGVITSYSSTSLIVVVDAISGSGSITGWSIKIIGNVNDDSAEPRILFLNKVDVADLPNSTDGIEYFSAPSNVNNFPSGNQTITNNIPLTCFIDPTKSYNLGFENSLIPDYYGPIADIVDRYKKVNALIRLNAADINKLDFTVPVYIRHFNAYFYINKIVGFRPGESASTQVELVKIF